MADQVASRDEARLSVTEIFASIQGESTWVGTPCSFIRLARCPLRCVWCDTAYAFHDGASMGIPEILDEVGKHGLGVAEITGGEPLAQEACPELAQALLEAGYTVLVETSGTLPIDRLPPAAIRIMDLKCPGSGESEKNHWPNVDLLEAGRDEVKFVIASRDDYEWSRGVVTRYTLEKRCKAVLFSPVADRIAPADLAGWIIEDRLPVRFQLQLHKCVWPRDARGV